MVEPSFPGIGSPFATMSNEIQEDFDGTFLILTLLALLLSLDWIA